MEAFWKQHEALSFEEVKQGNVSTILIAREMELMLPLTKYAHAGNAVILGDPLPGGEALTSKWINFPSILLCINVGAWSIP